MSLTTEEIAEIRDALQIIQGNADFLCKRFNYLKEDSTPKNITKQVKRIAKLLPKEQAKWTKSYTAK